MSQQELAQTCEAIRREQIETLEKLRSARARLGVCNAALVEVLGQLTGAGGKVASDMSGMRQDLDAAYAALRLVEKRLPPPPPE
ncbi:hypothetical protein HXX76_004829 [Chlamydomonas incerta]|uniref:Uncharacterized protein n=1 Tax=Chlamydomonas incerta TaxID=51695 RepID=A0A835TKP0_CHLIN|nr:hypothetical protein HXX76_004829 [Chlamydomonas incerta]|eukprot:KAG2439475.1 hypothetical protein HXX76_004829 [Chlamydomonas incerta]